MVCHSHCCNLKTVTELLVEYIQVKTIVGLENCLEKNASALKFSFDIYFCLNYGLVSVEMFLSGQCRCVDLIY